MKKRNYLLLFLLIFSVFCTKTYALTIRETTDELDEFSTLEEGSIIIGITRFSKDTVVTASKAATAGANDAMLYVTQTGSSKDYQAPGVYYYVDPYVGWFFLDSNNKVTTVTDQEELEKLSKIDIYYVDNKEKVFELEYTEGFQEGTNLPDGVYFENNKLFINATVNKLEIISKKLEKISFIIDSTTSKFVKDTRSCYTVSNGTITDYDSKCGNDIIIPTEINGEKITAIGSKAFKSTNLKSVIIPSEITSIEDNAFADNNLEKVIIKDKYDESEFIHYGNNVFGTFDNITYENELSRILNYVEEDFVIKYYKLFDINHHFTERPDDYYGLVGYILYSNLDEFKNNGYDKNYEYCWEKCNYDKRDINEIKDKYGIHIKEVDNLQYNFNIEKYDEKTEKVKKLFKTIKVSFKESGTKENNDIVTEAMNSLKKDENYPNLHEHYQVVTRIKNLYDLEDKYGIDTLLTELGSGGGEEDEITHHVSTKNLYSLKDGVLYQVNSMMLINSENIYIPTIKLEDYNNIDEYVEEVLRLFPTKSDVTNYEVKTQQDGKLYRIGNSNHETEITYYIDIFDKDFLEKWTIKFTDYYQDKYDSSGNTQEECFEVNNGIITKYNGTCGINVKIPNTINNQEVTEIASYTFYNMKLKSIKLPDTLKTINSSAFSYNNLTELKIPNSVTRLDNSSFEENEIENITLSNNLEKIGNYAFSYNKIKNVQIPSSVKSIERNAFGNNEIEELILPEGIESIDEYAFSHNKIKTLNIPNSITSIGGGAFVDNQLPDENAFIYEKKYDSETDSYIWDNTVITSYAGATRENIVIPNTVKTISSYSFEGLGLKEIEIPYGVETIGFVAFGYNELTHVTLPSTIKNLRGGTFSGNKLEGDNRFIYVHDEEGNIDNSILALFEIGDAYEVEEVVIPSNVKKIWPSSFSSGYINKLVIPYGVEEIGDYAFNSINVNGVITLPKSIIKIGEDIFNDNQRLTKEDGFVYARNEDGTVDRTIIMNYRAYVEDGILTIPEGVTEIKENAFSGSYSIREIILPSTLKTIHDNAFRSMSNLEKITFNEGLETIGDYAFYGSRIKEIKIPPTVKTIGNYAFNSNSNVTTITLKEGLEVIGNHAFDISSYINNVTIPSTVKTIGEYAFGIYNINTIEVLGKESLENFESIYDNSLMANEIIFENATQD